MNTVMLALAALAATTAPVPAPTPPAPIENPPAPIELPQAKPKQICGVRIAPPHMVVCLTAKGEWVIIA